MNNENEDSNLVNYLNSLDAFIKEYIYKGLSKEMYEAEIERFNRETEAPYFMLKNIDFKIKRGGKK